MIICYSQQSRLCTEALSGLKSRAQVCLAPCAGLYTAAKQEENPPAREEEYLRVHLRACVSFGGSNLLLAEVTLIPERA